MIHAIKLERQADASEDPLRITDENALKLAARRVAGDETRWVVEFPPADESPGFRRRVRTWLRRRLFRLRRLLVGFVF